MYQEIVLGSILLVTLYVLKRMRGSKLNIPPLVRYKFPIIGHTFSYMTNAEEFLKQCRQEYGDIFSLYILGDVRTFVGKENIQEVFAKDDSFDFGLATRKLYPLEVVFKYITEPQNSPKVLKEYVLSKLKLYSARMQKSLYSATQKYIGDCDEPKVISNLNDTMSRIISNPMANIFLGEEESEQEEVITTFAEFTNDAIKIMRIPPILNFIYPGLHNFLIEIPLRLGLYNPAIKHQKLLVKHIKNQVCKLLKEREKYGDSLKRSEGFLQGVIEEESFDPNNIDYVELADSMCFFIFASVHSTSVSCTNAIIDLASRPEYMQELYEEQLEVQKEADENGILPFEALNNMKKLDSFVRESMRLAGHVAALSHYVLKDYTFSNGIQVPKGHIVDLYLDDTLQDESLQGPNPKSFEPFRHLKNNSSATKISRSYLAFGGGKHACPGRHLAINEIKFFMHNAILKYNFRTENGKIGQKKKMGPISISCDDGIIFEKRNK